MLIAPIPDNETQRLQAVYDLKQLDSAHEERFDRLTRLARRLLGVSIAQVNLVDSDRVWFKSCEGFDATQAPRATSFCGHTILGDQMFVISDAQQDERFADNPHVTGMPYVRFYAGVPLSAANGAKVGTLCVVDDKPRTLSEDDVLALRDLAEMAQQEFRSFQAATTDELTGLSNRRGFEQLAQYSVQLCLRQHRPAALLYIDLDKFKPINDRYGHAEGDQALKEFAQVLLESFRRSDTLARIGGDEFVVLLANADGAAAQIALQKFVTAVTLRNSITDKPYALEYSCGVVQFDAQQHHSIRELMAAGDAMMYAIKQARKKRAT